MKPRLTPSQGTILRAVALYLSKVGGNPRSADRIVVEAITSQPWASLTFTGERHQLVVRLPGGTMPCDAIDPDGLDASGHLIAVEQASWHAAADGAVLTLDLLAIQK